MTDPVPVSPAAQAVETDVQAAAERVAAFLGSRYSSADPVAKTAVDTGPGPLDYYVGELRRADLHALVAAVRLVPAPGPDTEADDEKTPAAGPERITISLDTLWSCILVGVSGVDGVVPPTRRINAAVRLAHRAVTRDAAAGVRTDGETPQ